MKKPPRSKNEPILGFNGLSLILLFGLYTGFASLWIFTQLLPMGEVQARTAAFTAMVLFEKFSVFAFRSLREPCWRIGFLSNPLLLVALTITILAQVAAVYWPPLQVLLHTVGLSKEIWIMILTFALPILIVPELVKTVWFLSRRMQGQAQGAARAGV